MSEKLCTSGKASGVLCFSCSRFKGRLVSTEKYYRNCPSLLDNPNCSGVIEYKSKYVFKWAVESNTVCLSCAHVGRKKKKSISVYFRNCPNPKNNPKCRKLIGYPNLKCFGNANNKKYVCISCMKYGKYQNGVCSWDSLPRELSVKRFFVCVLDILTIQSVNC